MTLIPSTIIKINAFRMIFLKIQQTNVRFKDYKFKIYYFRD